MKKFWIVLLSLGLIMAFSVPAFAVDVKFNGEYKVQGIYEDNVTENNAFGKNQGSSLTWQRLRMGTEFKVAEGLTLTTRFDALERVWGAPRTTGGTNTLGTSNSGAIRDNESQNISFEQAYTTFNAAFGIFRVGYQTQGKFGTAFADNGERDNGPRFRYDWVSGPWDIGVIWEKMDGARNFTGGPNAMDVDWEKYHILGIFKWSTGEGGLLLSYVNNTSKSAYTNDVPITVPVTPNQTRQQVYQATPYFKAAFGPVYVEAEAAYVFGKQSAYVAPVAGKGDVDRSGYNGYVMAKVDLAPFYVGAAALYISGDDGQDTGKNKSGPGSGTDFNPCLIMLNYDLQRLGGGFSGFYNSAVGLGPYGYNTSDGSGMTNIYAYHIFAGVKPMPKLDVKASWTYAGFNEVKGPATLAQLHTNLGNPVNGQSKDIGMEFDLTATYKIYDNLSYMIGAAYFLPGDYFKAGGLLGAGVSTQNDYLLTHMLVLNF